MSLLRLVSLPSRGPSPPSPGPVRAPVSIRALFTRCRPCAAVFDAVASDRRCPAPALPGSDNWPPNSTCRNCVDLHRQGDSPPLPVGATHRCMSVPAAAAAEASSPDLTPQFAPLSADAIAAVVGVVPPALLELAASSGSLVHDVQQMLFFAKSIVADKEGGTILWLQVRTVAPLDANFPGLPLLAGPAAPVASRMQHWSTCMRVVMSPAGRCRLAGGSCGHRSELQFRFKVFFHLSSYDP